MNKLKTEEEVRGYCGLCTNHCPTIAHIIDGVFTEVLPDEHHPFTSELCPKGLAAPELVYNKQRLQYPMRRTNPKGSPDPGWERISWDEALDTIAVKLNEIKAKYGPEAVAFTRAGPGGSPLGELWPWVVRLAKAFGTPNNWGCIHICTWHEMFCSAYTYANPGVQGSRGSPQFEQSACILIWGNNVHATRSALVPKIKQGLERGAKLIVIDPRKIEIATMADLWLQIRPGTDGALALGMINIMLEENLYDYNFVRDWTTSPFLVRSDTGEFLMASMLTDIGDPTGYVMVDSASKETKVYMPGTQPDFAPEIDGTYTIRTRRGEKVECKTVFRLLREAVSDYQPDRTEVLTGIPEAKIRDAARMFATVKPACWYSWNGLEQTSNASQTNRAICILYALTGNYDMPGGNVTGPRAPVHSVDGHWLLSPQAGIKCLGFLQRPLGPAGRRMSMTTQGYEVYEAILTGKPYPVKALVGFGCNLATSNVPVLRGREAISQLDFHVEAELFMTPTVELADIVLPAASCWESLHISARADSFKEKGVVQMRPPVIQPQYDCWPDMKIIFELAKRLGLGHEFWNGNIEAAFNYQFELLDITVEKLKKSPSWIPIDVSMEYQRHTRKDDDGNFIGFPTPSKKVEIYSSTFKEYGHSPLPRWEEPSIFKTADIIKKYPLILINTKILEYCHSQHRALPSLRKKIPIPFLEINPVRASELGIKEGDWVVVETPYGGITIQAKLTDGINYDVVCTQNGWWQSCPELNLPSYDPYSSEGANAALLFSAENIDPVSGSVLMKGHPCNVRKAARP